MRTESQTDARLAAARGAWDGGAPDRAALLSAAYADTTEYKEPKPMTLFNSLLAGRTPAARFAIAALLLAAFGVLVFSQPGRGLAATEGEVLTYDLSAQADAEAVIGRLKELKTKLAAGLPDGTELKLVARVERREVRRTGGTDKPVDLRQPEMKDVTTASFIVSGDSAVLDQVAEAVSAEVPGLPAPRREDATWFSENGGMIDGIGIYLDFDGKGHQFTFPADASEAQIESTINAWLAENKPEFQHSVDVTISGDGQSERQIQVRIESKDGK